ncbi:iron complex transport system ATP-binding protein [Lutibacter agarilyticus]|uniref:Iron complex transport system ATP-binding protein n=1 Tax=Lutibacter agarilyticus TaxID=1109740 RepID=A0A238XLZ1_9FLAO|nr:ABC transporter ATP-binding protein [Lutibacter agarilyticus]SNR59692.1 iron complex transport system ATP-binding protein [Lutibacter agarilyticus]
MKQVTNPIIKTANLSIGYSSKKGINTIASNLNINLESGNLVCLLGKNGIGKSTLLRTITKVQPALEGDVLIDNAYLETFTNHSLAKTLSLVLTERLPDTSLTVYELVALGRQPFTNWIGYLTTNDLEIIQASFEKTNTQHLMNAKCHELSDGQLQKVLIARALAQDTPIIVLDEPTAHLDLHHTINTFTLLKKLAKDFNKTIIVSTHEINLALQIADALWLMTPTKFIAGTTAELISNNDLNLLFDSELISFNKTLKQFTINHS